MVKEKPINMNHEGEDHPNWLKDNFLKLAIPVGLFGIGLAAYFGIIRNRSTEAELPTGEQAGIATEFPQYFVDEPPKGVETSEPARVAGGDYTCVASNGVDVYQAGSSTLDANCITIILPNGQPFTGWDVGLEDHVNRNGPNVSHGVDGRRERMVMDFVPRGGITRYLVDELTGEVYPGPKN